MKIIIKVNCVNKCAFTYVNVVKKNTANESNALDSFNRGNSM